MNEQCHHCGQWHTGACPRVKSIEYYQNGMIKRVEYFDALETLHDIFPKPIPPAITIFTKEQGALS